VSWLGLRTSSSDIDTRRRAVWARLAILSVYATLIPAAPGPETLTSPLQFLEDYVECHDRLVSCCTLFNCCSRDLGLPTYFKRQGLETTNKDLCILTVRKIRFKPANLFAESLSLSISPQEIIDFRRHLVLLVSQLVFPTRPM